jgi:hypothetical protein
MTENKNFEDWKLGVIIAGGSVLFGATWLLRLIVPEAYQEDASPEAIQRAWDAYVFMMHLVPLLLLKVARTVFIKNYRYLVLTDAIMALIVGDLVDRLFGVTDYHWKDLVGIGVGVTLFLAKHYNWFVKWGQRIAKYYKK